MPSAKVEELKQRIERRKITPTHLLVAGLLKAGAEGKVLNQGVLSIIAPKCGELLYKYLQILGKSYPSTVEGFKMLVKDFDQIFDITADKSKIAVNVDGNKIEVRMGGELCKCCPKQVGFAEIPGSACPFPALLEDLARRFGIPVKLEVKKPFKRSELCHFYYVWGGR